MDNARDDRPERNSPALPPPTASLTVDGHVGIITMHDHRRHNALTSSHVRALLDAIAQSRRQRARALVIVSGVENFCAGADVDELLNAKVLEPGPKAPDVITPIALFRTLLEDPRPVVAAIDGLALGGGLELALSCDLVLAAPTARFGMPEIGLGVLPRTALVRLPEIVGQRKALELILTRRKIDADEACAIGLVNRVVDKIALIEVAVQTAADIVKAPPTAISAVKKNLGRVPPGDWEGFEALLADLAPPEWREGLSAFAGRRRPDYEALWAAAFDSR